MSIENQLTLEIMKKIKVFEATSENMAFPYNIIGVRISPETYRKLVVETQSHVQPYGQEYSFMGYKLIIDPTMKEYDIHIVMDSINNQDDER